jgi:WS/DGAT/MGAT family acyltransferase
MNPVLYERLAAIDNSFLVFEKSDAYMHVACTQIFDAGRLLQADGGIDVGALERLVESKLHLIPRYRQKLAFIPIEQYPVWVDDPNFNLKYHIRHTSLPRPGDARQLKRLSARIMQQHLDRRRPLWEIWVVEGLEGDRFATVMKVHHCMVDGISGVDLMRVMMSPSPDETPGEAPPYVPRTAPSGLLLLRDEFVRRASMPIRALRSMRDLVTEATDAGTDLAVRLRSVAEALGATLRRVSDTPLNGRIGPHRRFDWLAMELADVKAIRQVLGGTLNDIVLTIVAGAVRSFLIKRRVNPDFIEFRIMAPVSVRKESEQGTLGNRISTWIVDLPLDESKPRERHRRICEQTEELRHSNRAEGADVLMQVAEWTPSTLLALGARSMSRLLPFNMVVTNVPGPQIPLYFMGAQMREVYPHVPLLDPMALGIALMSYDGRLFWGFNADYDRLPDLHDFVEAIQGAFEELQELVRSRPRLVKSEVG